MKRLADEDYKKQLFQALNTTEKNQIVNYIRDKRWFCRKSEKIVDLKFNDIAIISKKPLHIISIIEIFYEKFNSEAYYFPLTCCKTTGKEEKIFSIAFQEQNLNFFNAFQDINFCSDLLHLISKNSEVDSFKGRFKFIHTNNLDQYKIEKLEENINLISSEQSNTSINFNNQVIMKNFRNLQYGQNPDYEITHFLTQNTNLKNIPALLGNIDYFSNEKNTATAAVLQEFIFNQGDCWSYTINNLEQIYRIAMRNGLISKKEDILPVIYTFAKDYLEEIKTLGEITASFHKALTLKSDDKAFDAEQINDEDVNQWSDFMVNDVLQVLNKIEENFHKYTDDVKRKVSVILQNKDFYIEAIKKIKLLKNINQKKIRIHGDYHLGQILKTKDSFVILDFEGEPIRTIEERRAKFLPQKDVAGMLRSINYAANASLFNLQGLDKEEFNRLSKWAFVWEELVSEHFLSGYFNIMGELLTDIAIFKETLTAFQIDKAIYELNYEINNRPDWLKIPVEYLKLVLEK